MTDTHEQAFETVAEALSLVERGLGELAHRELVSTDEMADLLLDVRTLLAVSLDGRELSHN
jgi:hypothetical protein